MPDWYEVTVVREIFWKGKTYLPGATIRVIRDDMQILFDAGVAGNMKKIDEPRAENVEQMVRKPPENQMKFFRKQQRG